MSVSESQLVAEYAAEIKQMLLSGHAREHAYRPALKRLMANFEDITPVNDPKKSEHGNPDMAFIKESHTNIILGYAEAKDIDKSLEKTLNSEQLRRYAGYANLFLTNYLEFRFLRNGEQYEVITIGRLHDGTVTFDETQFARLYGELAAFLEQPPESIRSGKRLAVIMGGKARRIRESVKDYLGHEEHENYQELEKIYKMMRKLLVHDLTIEKFADMYAQTLVYGLFVARYNDKTPEGFSRSEARDLVPASNPFLQVFFDHIVGPQFVKRFGYIVDELCEVFSVSDVHMLVQKHLKLFDFSDDKDPIIHFYEDFLREYDPAERKKMGAYYTPVPVVRFMIRQVDEALKRDFGLAKGLADTTKKPVTVQLQGTKTKVDMHKVQVLDPAVGTATFLNEIILHIYGTFKGQEGRWPAYATQDLLPRLYGFELMMAPYTIAHLKLGMTLAETGVTNFGRRLGVYLTNTLEEGVKLQQDLFSFGLAEVVSKEADEAATIKSERPIMVIIGNPPYSGESSNKTAYASALVNKYKVEPGGQIKLQERNPKWINDDYVKFIAFAEDMIAKNGEGVVAMITNHGYLDNPTFRGMRWHLAKTFDEIRLLDLHGNTKKKEVSPDGGKDENVFDIQQGVAIMIATKTGKKRANQPAKIYHADLYGKRRSKFDALDTHNQEWRELTLDKQMYFFVPQDTTGKAQYEKGVKLDELFLVLNVGVVTGGDSVLIGHSKEEVQQKLEHAQSEGGKGKVYERLQGAELDQAAIRPLAYRPFDSRYVYYAPGILERARENVMQHYLPGENIGLLFSRMTKGKDFAHAFITDHISEVIYLSPLTGTNAFNAPLYLYHTDGTRTPNFKPEMLKRLTKNLKQTYEPENVLQYIYAVLHSPAYRESYKEFLKSDFPRIPLPKNDAQFKRLATLGRELQELHLMTAALLNEPMTTYPVAGNNAVERLDYEDGKVWINQTQYFGNVPLTAWDFCVGGYRPAYKWLRDRKGQELSNWDIEHYQKMVTALAATERIMSQIDG